MSTTKEVDVTVDRRTDWRLHMLWENPAGTPVNLTGYQARAQIRRNESSDPAATMDIAGGGVTLGGIAGTIDLYLPKTATVAIASGRYDWDLLIGPSGGDVRKLVKGKALVVTTMTDGTA